MFFFWILLLLFFFLAGNILFGGGNDLSIYDLANWDGRHFLDISISGYSEKSKYAFFPLYPILLDFFSFNNRSFLYAGILINLLALLGSIYILLLLLKKFNMNPLKAVIYLLIFPTSFYLLAVYSESLFLFLTLMTFYFAEKKKFYIAGFFSSLASITRITGIAVILSLVAYLFLSKLRFREKFITVMISSSGLLCYSIYLYLQTGNPFYFFISELTWGRSIEIPGANIRDAVLYTAVNGIRPESFTILSDLLFTIFGLGMGIRVIRFLKPPLAVYTIAALFIPLTTALLLSVPRFLLVVFPIFIVLAKINNRIFNISYVIISLTLLFLYFNFFLRNIWVS